MSRQVIWQAVLIAVLTTLVLTLLLPRLSLLTASSGGRVVEYKVVEVKIPPEKMAQTQQPCHQGQ